MENDVNGISTGVNAFTASKACESVMTSFGFCERLLSMAGSSSVWHTKARPLWSKISRIVCTCGKIRRPFGAAESIGHTKMIVSPGSTNPCNRDCSPSTSSGVNPPSKSSNVRRSRFDVKSVEPTTVAIADKSGYAST